MHAGEMPACPVPKPVALLGTDLAAGSPKELWAQGR